MSRDVGGSFCCGLAFGGLIGNALIEGSTVRNVTTPNDQDADGLALFGKIVDGRRVGKVTVRDSAFLDCEGRAVKFQLNAATAEDNSVEHDAGKTITNYQLLTEGRVPYFSGVVHPTATDAIARRCPVSRSRP